MLVPTFNENRSNIIPDEFYDSLPNYCFCEYPMEMTEALTQLRCSNPRCPNKVAMRLVAISNTLGVKDLGKARAKKFIDNFGITNPLLIFGYEPEEDGQMAPDISIDVSNKIVNQFVTRNSFTLVEYVKIANLPYIQTSASSIFGEFDDLQEAYKKIEEGGVEYIRNKLNIKMGDVENVISVRAIRIYETLMTFKDDLFQGISFVNIIKTNTSEMRKILAVCSDEVGDGFRTKADFYATCNNKFSNIHIEFGNSVTMKTEFVVWAGADGSPARLTNKVKKARGYNDGGKNDHEIKIVTAKQFLSLLEECR